MPGKTQGSKGTPTSDKGKTRSLSRTNSAPSNKGNAGEKPAPVRKERSKSRDLEKRMGGGQKGVWSKKNNEVMTAVTAVDGDDPNYDSEAEENVVLISTGAPPAKKSEPINLEPDDLAAKELAVTPPLEIKKRIVEILEEYLTSGDIEEVISALEELDQREFHYEVVKRAMTMAMDRHDKERERVSRLLSALYLNSLTPPEIAMGFKRVLLLADDLQIDIPSARTMLALFCARAIVDEILPPSFLEDPFITRYAPSIAAEAIQKLSISHGSARMEKAWGPGDGRPVDELKTAIDHLTKEYLMSGDKEEAKRCVKELDVPQFHHEVVKQGIVNALEEKKDDDMVALLEFLIQDDVMTKIQLSKGVERVRQRLGDLELDIPKATERVDAMILKMKGGKMLEE